MTSRRLRVMLVEDEMLIALSLEDMITEMGHEVVGMASRVDNSLALLDRLPEAPDAAVVDANLDGSSALPVVAALRERGTTVVIASGYSPAELERLGFREPALGKPYQPAELARALSDALQGNTVGGCGKR